jgi:hypothetical protein
MVLPRQTQGIARVNIGGRPMAAIAAIRASDCDCTGKNDAGDKSCSCSTSNCPLGQSCYCNDGQGVGTPVCRCQ